MMAASSARVPLPGTGGLETIHPKKSAASLLARTEARGNEVGLPNIQYVAAALDRLGYVHYTFSPMTHQHLGLIR